MVVGNLRNIKKCNGRCGGDVSGERRDRLGGFVSTDARPTQRNATQQLSDCVVDWSEGGRCDSWLHTFLSRETVNRSFTTTHAPEN